MKGKVLTGYKGKSAWRKTRLIILRIMQKLAVLRTTVTWNNYFSRSYGRNLQRNSNNSFLFWTAYAAPALFGFGMLGGFGDKFGGLFGQKRKEPTYSPMFGGSFGGINAQDMSMMFMSGFPPNGGMQGGMMGGMGGGMPGNRQSMGGLGRGGGMPGMGGSLGQQSLGLGGSGFGKRRRRRSIRYNSIKPYC